jgi:hypothetical protein
MPENLNLLPQDLQVSKGTKNTLKTVKALGTIFIVLFALFCLGLGGYFIYSRITLTNIQANVDQLKKQVTAMEASEQQLVLLKDRLGKIISIKSTPNASKNVTHMDTLFAGMSQGFTPNQVSIAPSKMSMSLNILSNDDLSAFMRNVKTTELFNQIELTSFSYTMSGYNLELNLGQIETKQ